MQQHSCLIFWKFYKNYQNKASEQGAIFWCDSNKARFWQIVTTTWINYPVSPRLKNYGMQNRILEWLNEITWMIEWLHSHWVLICYLRENRNNQTWNRNLSRVLVLWWRIFVVFIFAIEEPQNGRFYENGFTGLQAG